jgi:hypothetical protein
MSERRRRSRIPGPAEWRGYENDLDAKWAHKLLFGKSIEEVQMHFGGGRSIERSSELLYLPRSPFQYYVRAYALFVRSEAARGDPDPASSFLNLLINREERDPGSVAQIWDDLRETVELAAWRQQWFDADENIYGSFREKEQRLRRLLGPQ